MLVIDALNVLLSGGYTFADIDNSSTESVTELRIYSLKVFNVTLNSDRCRLGRPYCFLQQKISFMTFSKTYRKHAVQNYEHCVIQSRNVQQT
jgi:hypothetical protein